MKSLLLVTTVVFLYIQGLHSAPAESDLEEALSQLSDSQLNTLAETLITSIQRETQPQKRAITKKELLADATKMTEVLIEQEKAAAVTGTMNEATAKLLQFLSSSPQIKRAGLAAHTQLEAIRQYREHWLHTRGLKDEADFWTDMKRDMGSSFLKENPDLVHPDTRQTIHQPDTCPFPKLTCTGRNNYRTIDGSCNNLETDKESLGSAHRAQARFLEPEYGDGFDAPRLASDGTTLPSARLISRSLYQMEERLSGIYTLLNMVFGQFLDHDLSHTPAAFLATNLDTLENATINCGTDGCDEYNGDLSQKECFPIPFTEGDMYSEGRACIPFVRSQAYLNSNCDLLPREQANSITSWLDGSMVYGSEFRTRNQLVEAGTGKMIMMEHPINPSLKPLLPPSSTTGNCKGLTDVIKCFHAGDVRQNEVVSLTAMHTVFARMHNHILEQLTEAYEQASRPLPPVDRLFQETRKILGGVWQHIVYNEYLRALLGSDLMKQHHLEPQQHGFFHGYNPDISGEITNVFAAAALRFGHSEIPDMMRFASTLYDVYEEMHLSEIMFNPKTLYHSPVPDMSGVDAILLGMISARAEAPDDLFCGQITNHLFSSDPPFGVGLDLPALNIQRARDHGIPGYASWRRYCDLDNPNSINDFVDIPGRHRQTLKELYDDVEDVDLYAAAMLERPSEHSQIGPTFGCLIARQFENLKRGDRFYYENEAPTGFTAEQLGEIRKFTLARLLCDTLDDVPAIQKYVLIQPHKDVLMKNKQDIEYLYGEDENERRPCSDIPNLDYSTFLLPEPPGSQG